MSYLFGDTSVDSVEDARHANEDGGPQCPHIVQQRLGIALPVADGSTEAQERLLSDSVEYVGLSLIHISEPTRPY